MRTTVVFLTSSSLLASVLLAATPAVAEQQTPQIPARCVESLHSGEETDALLPTPSSSPDPSASSSTTPSALAGAPPVDADEPVSITLRSASEEETDVVAESTSEPSETAATSSPTTEPMESPSPTTEPTQPPSPSPSSGPTEWSSATPSPTPLVDETGLLTDEPTIVTEEPVLACPSPVADLTVTPRDQALGLHWTVTDEDVTDIWVEVSPSGSLTRVDPGADTTTVTGLRNGVEHRITVTTSNDRGASESVTVVGVPSIDGPTEVAAIVVSFASGVDARVGRTDVPGEDSVMTADLTIGEDLGAGLHRVNLSEPVPAAVAEDIARELASDPSVVTAEPDYLLLPATDPAPWNLAGDFGVQLPATVDPTAGEGAAVAIIDTGSTDHPDLRWGSGRDFVSSPDGLDGVRVGEQAPFDGDAVDLERFGPLGWDDDPTDPGDWRTGRDSTWHGTSVAGIVSATAPAATIVPVRAVSWRGGLLSDIAAGITWASGGSVGSIPGSATPADVIVLSLAAQATCTPILQQAITAATDRGSLVIAAAGNGSADARGYLPASCADVLTVGSSTSDGVRADYSNFGSAVDLSAPGGTASVPVAVLSNSGTRTPDSASTSTAFGTSIAAAHVAGIAADYRSRFRDQGPEAVARALSTQVQPFSGGACDADTSVTCGSGIVLAQVAATTDAVVASYAIGTAPKNVELTADETKVVVTNKDSDTVSVLTVATESLVTYSVNPDPVHLTIDGSSTAYISHEGSAVVTSINLTSGAVSTIDFGTCSTTGGLAHQSSKLYLACGTDTKVWNGTTVTSIAVPVLRFTATASHLYGSTLGSSTVYRIDPASDSFTTLGISIEGGTSGFAVEPTGTYFFAVNLDNWLRQYRVSDNVLLKAAQATEVRRSGYIAFSGTDRLYILNDRGNFVTLTYDASGWTWLRRIIVGPNTDYNAYGLDVTTDGAFAWVTTSAVSGESTGGYLRKIALGQTTAAAPTGLTATATDSGASIAFTPGNAGSASVTNYEYRLYSGSWGAWTALSPAVTTSPITLSGLTNGTSYTAQLRAVTSIGAGDSSSSVSFTPGRPEAPTGLSASVTTASADVSFTPGANGGASITNYEYSTDSGTSWTALSPADSTSPVTIAGLTGGTPYSVRLRAVNGIATGLASSSVSFTTSAIAPSAPTAVNVTPSSSSAQVVFTAGSNGGSAITDYEYSLDGGSTWTSAGRTSSPITVAGLVEGTTYSLELRAVNAVGSGVASGVTTFTTPRSSVEATSPVTEEAPVSPRIPEAVLVAPIAPIAPEVIPEAGIAAVLVDGRSVAVDTRKVNSGSWRVTGPDFSVEFTPAEDPAESQVQFSCPAGSWVQVDGDGFAPGAIVSAYLFAGRMRSAADALGQRSGRSGPVTGEPVLVGRGSVQSDGSVQVRADIPLTANLGRHALQVSALGPDGAVRVVTMGMQVVAGAPRVIKERSAAAAFFQGDSSRFSSFGKSRLRSLVSSLPDARGEVRINVSAVATSRSDFSANLRLATKRAREIREYLDRRGVDGAITVTLTTGEAIPAEGAFARSSRGKLLTTVTIGYEVAVR